MSFHEHAQRAQRAAEAHIAEIDEWRDEYGEDDIDGGPPSPAVAPYDGCDTCMVRETLHAAYPHMMAAAREEVLEELAALPPVAATGSRDFGRGYALAMRDVADAVSRRPLPASERPL